MQRALLCCAEFALSWGLHRIRASLRWSVGFFIQTDHTSLVYFTLCFFLTSFSKYIPVIPLFELSDCLESISIQIFMCKYFILKILANERNWLSLVITILVWTSDILHSSTYFSFPWVVFWSAEALDITGTALIFQLLGGPQLCWGLFFLDQFLLGWISQCPITGRLIFSVWHLFS